MVPDEILERLRCPQCGAPVLEAEGGIRCRTGHGIRMPDGYIDLSSEPLDPNTAGMYRTFGYQHTVFDTLPPQDAHVWGRYFSDVPFDRLKGGVGLDAGCGNGRFAAHLAERLRALVALDGSIAARAAARNLARFTNVAVIRGDFRSAPLRPRSFDFVCSIGVLHHFTDPEDGFRALTRLLAPGGFLLVFVYSRPPKGTVRYAVVRGTAALRRATVHLPHGAVRAISALLAPALYVTLVVPGRAGERFRVERLRKLPLSMYRQLPLKTLWQSVFDALSAPLERRYTWPEIEPWFSRAGLSVESVRDDDGLIVLAHAPPDS